MPKGLAGPTPPKAGLLISVSLAVAGLALLLVLRACAHGDRAADLLADAGAADASTTLVQCVLEPKSVALGEGLVRGDLLVGEAVSVGDTYGVGLVRPLPKSGRRASVALLKDDLGAAAFVDLGPATGDLPPPRPFVYRGDLFTATYGRGTDSRALSVARIDRTAEPKAVPFAEIAQQMDESLAFDVVTSGDHGIVAWDEDAPAGDVAASARGPDAGAERGVIKVAPIPASSEKSGAGTIVSPGGADVERPHGVARAGGGFWLGWIARRRDPRGENDPRVLEVPGEDRSFSWVEIARVDDGGKRVGDVRRVTSDAGHATAFDWLSGADGKLDLFVRDDAEMTHEGEGGRILRVSVRDDGVQPPQAVVAGGVGQGDPAPVGDSGGRWLFYGDVAEHTNALFLGTAAHDVGELGSSVAVPVLDGQSVLLARSATLLFAVGPSAEGKDQAEAHIVRCEALNR